MAMSASCCMILSPVASSSSKPLAISWRFLASGTGVSRAWPVADDCSVSSFRSSSRSSRSSCAWRLKSSSGGVFSRALLEFERREWCSCSDSDEGSTDLFDLYRPLGLRSSQILAIRPATWPIVWSMLFKEFKMCSFVSISTAEAVPGESVGTTAWFDNDSPSALIFNWENQKL